MTGWKYLEGERQVFETEVDDEDSEHLEEADRFEMEYNFRYCFLFLFLFLTCFIFFCLFRHAEPGVGERDNVLGYSREQPDSLRKTKSKRKKQRERKQEREELEKVRKAEEIKRLKAMKRSGIH